MDEWGIRLKTPVLSRYTVITASVSCSSPGSSATLTATVSPTPITGHTLSIYDDLGNRLLYKYAYEVPPAGQVSLTVSPPLTQTRTYTAYIAKDFPTPGPPRDTVRAIASLTFASGTLADQTMEGVSLGLIPTLCTDEQITLALSAAPMATHTQGSSLSDQALIYNGANAWLDSRSPTP